jgi:Flp pilus assembly protein TadG
MSQTHVDESENGAAAVEMAMLLPLLFMILFGIIDFGRMYNAQITVTEAAREAARAVVLAPGETDATLQGKAMAKAAAKPLTINDSDITISQTCDGENDKAIVTVQYNFSFITPLAGYVPALSDGPITAQAVMPCPG